MILPEKKCAGQKRCILGSGARGKVQKQFCSHASKAKISLNKGEQKGSGEEEMLRKQSRDEAERSGSASVVPDFSFPRC